MPLTIQEFRSATTDDLLEKYSPQEIRTFIGQLDLPQPEAQPETRPRPSAREWITPYDPSEDFFSAKNLGTMAGNIPGSAYHMAGDVAEAVTSPIETGKALWETGAGGLLEGLGRRFGVTYDEEEGLDFDPELLKKTLVEDPAGVALDVAPVGAAVGRVAGLGRIGRAALSPVRAAAETARGAGTGVATATKAVASAMSGMDPGVLTTAREVLGETGKAGKRGRAAFESARKGPDAIPQAVEVMESGISSRLDDIGSELRASVGVQRVAPKEMSGFDSSVLNGLRGREIKLRINADGSRGLDFRLSAIPEEIDAQRRILKAMRSIIQARKGGTFQDLWRARRQIDEANSTALKQKFGNTEIGILKDFRGELNKLMDTVDNPKFKELNKEYREGIELRDRFDKLAGTRVDPEGQISAVIRAIRQGKGSSEKFLRKVEEQTGTPLRAIAAGTELQGLLPRGLVGRGLFAGVATLTFGPEVLVALFLAPPAALRFYLKRIGEGDRVIRALGTFTDNLMGLPNAAMLAEQGLTIGGIINQLSEQAEQPSFLGQLAPASAGSMRTGVLSPARISPEMKRPSTGFPQPSEDLSFEGLRGGLRTRDAPIPEIPRPRLSLRRFAGSPPEEKELELLGPVSGKSIPGIERDSIDDVGLPSAESQIPVTQPSLTKPLEIEEKKELSTMAPVVPGQTFMEKARKSSEALDRVVATSASAVGGVALPDTSVVVLDEALKAESNPRSFPILVLDPNINEATYYDEQGKTVGVYPIGTGDITGEQYGEKYFTPHGEYEVLNRAGYKDVEGSFGPLWMGLGTGEGEKLTGPGGGGIGLHGPHARASFDREANQFINQGWISHGCIRFQEKDILEIGRLLDIGSRVEIKPYREELLSSYN